MKVADHLFGDAIEVLQNRPLSLLNGDLHGENLFIKSESGAALIVDWQTCHWGPMALDLARSFVEVKSEDPPEVWLSPVLRVYAGGWAIDVDELLCDLKSSLGLILCKCITSDLAVENLAIREDFKRCLALLYNVSHP